MRRWSGRSVRNGAGKITLMRSIMGYLARASVASISTATIWRAGHHMRALLLSGGQQKLVALARALVAGTRLLLLDEPFEGVAPALANRLADVIAGLKGSHVAVLIAQSDLNHARRLVDSEIVVERGANVQPLAAL